MDEVFGKRKVSEPTSTYGTVQVYGGHLPFMIAIMNGLLGITGATSRFEPGSPSGRGQSTHTNKRSYLTWSQVKR